MALEVSVNSGSGNGLVPNGTKPLPEPVLTYLVTFTWWQCSLGILKISFTKFSVTYLKAQPHLSGNKDLIPTYYLIHWSVGHLDAILKMKLLPLCNPQYSTDPVHIWYSHWPQWEHEPYWLWGFYVHFLGSNGTLRFNEYINLLASWARLAKGSCPLDSIFNLVLLMGIFRYWYDDA